MPKKKGAKGKGAKGKFAKGKDTQEKGGKQKKPREERDPYVGRIGDADAFIDRLRNGECSVETLAKSRTARREYEFSHVFDIPDKDLGVPDETMAARMRKHKLRDSSGASSKSGVALKKLELADGPSRFAFLGRYDFLHRELFTLVWNMITATARCGKRKTKFFFRNNPPPAAKEKRKRLVLAESDTFGAIDYAKS